MTPIKQVQVRKCMFPPICTIYVAVIEAFSKPGEKNGPTMVQTRGEEIG